MSVMARPFRALLLAVVASVAVTACESPAGNVSVLQSSTVAVVPGSTYAWAPISDQARAAADPRVSNDIIQERLRTAVDGAMAARGFRRIDDPATAQLLVSFHVGLQSRTETQVNTWGGGSRGACGFRGCVGGWGFYGPPQVDVRNINYTQGTLILDVTDRASGKLAWRATSDKRVDSSDATQEGMNAILLEMTRTLPGATAG
jgi:hypothetical protein